MTLPFVLVYLHQLRGLGLGAAGLAVTLAGADVACRENLAALSCEHGPMLAAAVGDQTR